MHIYSCGATQSALYVGVLVPFLTVYIFNWTIFVVIMVARMRSDNSKIGSAKQLSRKAMVKQQCHTAITISVLFGLGWVFGLAATQAIHIAVIRIFFNILFTTFITLQGLFIFILYVVLSSNARNEWKKWILRCKHMCTRPDTVATITSPITHSSAMTAKNSSQVHKNHVQAKYLSLTNEFSSIYDNSAPVTEDVEEFYGKGRCAMPSNRNVESESQSPEEDHETAFVLPRRNSLQDQLLILSLQKNEATTSTVGGGICYVSPFLDWHSHCRNDGSQLAEDEQSNLSLDIDACLNEDSYDDDDMI